MTKLEQAARQALEALEELFHSNSTKVALEKYNTAHNALLEALEQPNEIDWIETNKALAKEIIELKKQAEQEPVAWRVRGYSQFKTGDPAPWRYVDGVDKPSVNKPDCCDFEPLYAAPVRTKDLTEYELDELRFQNLNYLDYARAVIAADREKNK